MILTALHHYYLRRLAEQHNEPSSYRAPIAPWGYTEQGISFALCIKADGRLARVLDLRVTQNKKIFPRRMMVPWYLKAAVRTSGKVAFPLWDKPAYALGAEETKETPEHHALFCAHVNTLAAAVDDAGLEALRLFGTTFTPDEAMQLPNWDELSKSFCVFQLEGDSHFLHERPAVKAYWDANWQAWSHENESGQGQCLISGEVGPLALLHQPTKGVRGAQSSGARLVSFNCTAFESYGHRSGHNAPVGELPAFAYTTALNYLLRQDNGHCLQVDDTATLFWAERNTRAESLVVGLFDISSDETVERETDEGSQGRVDDLGTAKKIRDILVAARAGDGQLDEAIAELDPEAIFYILGIAPNMARLSIRYWQVCTFGALIHHVGRFVRETALERQFANQPEFPSVWHYLLEFAPLRKAENIPHQAAGALVRSLFTGFPYPNSLLPLLLSRIRADQEVTYLRAALIKAVLMRNYGQEVSPMLNEDRTDVPYLLGRLFALLEKAQLDAHQHADADDSKKTAKVLNKTIRDKFFGAASATPGVVFPQLLNLNRHHIAKSEYGKRLDITIQQVIEKGIDDFPIRLSLLEQGTFNIGYYHQRAANYKKSGKQEGDNE